MHGGDEAIIITKPPASSSSSTTTTTTSSIIVVEPSPTATTSTPPGQELYEPFNYHHENIISAQPISVVSADLSSSSSSSDEEEAGSSDDEDNGEYSSGEDSDDDDDDDDEVGDPRDSFLGLALLYMTPTRGIYIYQLYKLAYPVVIGFFLQLLISTVNLIFVGHLGAKSLAAAALGNMFANVTGYAIGFGLPSGLDTLAPQAFGAKRYHLVGVLAQRSMALVTIGLLPVFVMWWFSADILRFARQDDELASMAGKYVRRLIPGLWPVCMYEVLEKYLQAGRVVHFMVYIGVLVNVANVFFCWLFIHYLDWRFDGAPYATVCSQWLLLLSAVTFALVRGLHKRTWPGWQWVSMFRNWRPLLVLGFHGTAMLCFEWWCFEIAALGAGRLGQIPLASYVVIINLMTLLFMFPLGISNSLGTLVGNALGAQRLQVADELSRTAILMNLCSSTMIALVLFLSRSHIARLFSEDAEVIHTVGRTMPYAAALMFCDHFQGVLAGVLRGSGRQALGTMVNLVGYYGMSIPLSFTLAFKTSMGIDGLFVGLISGVLFTGACYLFIVITTDWQKCATQFVESARQEEAFIDACLKVDGVQPHTSRYTTLTEDTSFVS